MVGVVHSFEAPELDGLLRRLEAGHRRLPAERVRLADDIGGYLESSVKLRVADQKEAPDGDDWPLWSEGYAATRHEGQSLLRGEGDLLDSIQFFSSVAAVEVGSNLVYAAIHQFGGDEVGRNIPARPYLGISRDDELGVQGLVEDFLRGMMA